MIRGRSVVVFIHSTVHMRPYFNKVQLPNRIRSNCRLIHGLLNETLSNPFSPPPGTPPIYQMLIMSKSGHSLIRLLAFNCQMNWFQGETGPQERPWDGTLEKAFG